MADTVKESTDKKAVEKVEKRDIIKTTKRPARKRTKKEKVSPVVKEITVMIETGKYVLGYRRAYKEMLLGNSKIVIVANGSRKDIKEDLVKYAEEGKIPLIEFKGNSLELGSICGKSHPVSVIVVFDQGKSKLLDLAKKWE